jgi:hypothetical protein
LPELVRVWEITFPAPLEKPVIFGDPLVAVHENVAPVTLEVNRIFVVCPEHCEGFEGLINTSGKGKTVTT